MPKCSYCGKDYPVHEGFTFVRTSGIINYLCSSKCKKNMLMKRRRTPWISKQKVKKIKSSESSVELKKE